MSFDKRTLAVIQAIYDAALDESRWPQALKNLSEITGSQAATFWVLDGSEGPRLVTFTYIDLDPAFIQEYLDCMVPLDPWNQYWVSRSIRSNEASTTLTLVDNRSGVRLASAEGAVRLTGFAPLPEGDRRRRLDAEGRGRGHAIEAIPKN